MKKLFTLLALVFCTLAASAQFNRFNYTCIIKDANGQVAANRNIKMKFVLTDQMSNEKYVETHEIKSTSEGLVQTMIGLGNPVAGESDKDNMDNLIGNSRAHISLQVSIDPDGKGYSIFGSSELPNAHIADFANYASLADNSLHAEEAGTAEVALRAYDAQSADHATTADNATTAGNVTSLGDMPMTTLNVKVVNPTSSKVDVSILGQNITGNDTKSFSVPAYCPTFLSVDINESKVKYTVKLNGEEIASETGSYQKSDTYPRRVFDTGLASNQYEYDLSKAVFEYYPVMDNAEGDKSGRYCANDKKLLNNTDCRNYQTASNYTVSASYENNVYIEGQAEIQASDKWMGYADLNLRHWKSGNKTFPLYVKIPSFSYKNTFTETPIYKHGYNLGFFFKNMKNEVIGPFPEKTNTLVIEVIAIVK